MNLKRMKKPIILITIILLLAIALNKLDRMTVNTPPVISISDENKAIIKPEGAGLLDEDKNEMAAVSSYAGYNEEYFAEFRLNREKRRGEEIELLRQIIQDLDSGSDVKEQISNKLIDIINKNELESQTEVIIKSCGIKDCAVIVKDEAMSIIVSEELSKDEKSRLQTEISRAADLEVEKVSIISRRS